VKAAAKKADAPAAKRPVGRPPSKKTAAAPAKPVAKPAAKRAVAAKKAPVEKKVVRKMTSRRPKVVAVSTPAAEPTPIAASEAQE
jgi:hypothetical protein